MMRKVTGLALVEPESNKQKNRKVEPRSVKAFGFF